MEFLLLDGRDEAGRAEFYKALNAPLVPEPGGDLFRLLGVA